LVQLFQQQLQQIQRVGNKMEVLTINKYYTDSSGKVLFVDASLTITRDNLSKTANNIFSVDLDEYQEDMALKKVLASTPGYDQLQRKVYSLFKIANLTETEV